MNKIFYISNSVERLTNLLEFEIVREKLSTDLSLTAVGPSDIILINHDDLIQATSQLLETMLTTLRKSNRPLLLLAPDSIISAVDNQQIFQSGYDGLITNEVLASCYELFMNPEQVKQSDEWGVTLSLIEPFAQAIVEVLQKTFSTKSSLTAIVNGRILPPEGEFSSSMIIQGEIEGQAVAVLAQEQTRMLVARLLGCDKDELTKDDLADGVNEIINQVSGRVRTMEWPEKYKFNIDLPKLVECKASTASLTTKTDWITLLVECYGQFLSLSIRAEKVKNPVSLLTPA